MPNMPEETYFYQYFFVGAFVLFAIVFPVAILIVAGLIAPKKPSPIKATTYECGLESKGDSWIQFRIQYYLFALIFVIFDVETIFIFPWAVAFKQLGLFAFAEMILFIAILATALAYAWRKKILEWD
jgi:NADH-quinone oxidoreductase subunit A